MNAKILVIDDTPAALKLLKDILSIEGYDVRPFNNGELALRSARAEAPDLVLLDIRMPGMNGFEVCGQLKADSSLGEVPVIFISAATDLEDKVRGFEAGGVDYITKPFQKEEVLARVKTHVELHRSRRELRRTAAELRRSEEILKIAQAIAHLGHWELDVEDGTVRWSDETYRILGYDPRDFEPNQDSLFNAIHPEDRESVMANIAKTRDGEGFNFEHRVVLPDGRVRMVHSVGKIVCCCENEQPLVVATIQDITERVPRQLLGVIQDITERKELEMRLEAEARTDSLTGCATRRRFLEVAHQEVERARRYGSALSLLMIDLDHFKRINDVYGHEVGDRALQALARVCRETLREEDVVGRLGGEEFGVLLPESDGDQAIEAGKRLREAIAAVEVPLGNGLPLRFTASLGVATLSLSDAGVEVLQRRADQAMYAAKAAGRNTVCAASEPDSLPG